MTTYTEPQPTHSLQQSLPDSSTGPAGWKMEWPTWCVAAAIYGGFVGLVAGFQSLSAIAGSVPVYAAMALLVAWQSSLVHECVHGHPTRRSWINALVGGAPLSPHIPYVRYRDVHLAHHAADHLTKPGRDSESFYLDEDVWTRLPQWRRALAWANMTLAGRMVLGPWIEFATWMAGELTDMARGDWRKAGIWGMQALLVSLFLIALEAYGIGWWQYGLFVVYPAMALMKVRSFLEHRPGPEQAHRTAIVESGWFWSLLFLNNNLHVVHHDRPRLAWYDIPGVYRRNKARIARKNGGYVVHGYGDVFRRYLLRPQDCPMHPGAEFSS